MFQVADREYYTAYHVAKCTNIKKQFEVRQKRHLCFCVRL